MCLLVNLKNHPPLPLKKKKKICVVMCKVGRYSVHARIFLRAQNEKGNKNLNVDRIGDVYEYVPPGDIQSISRV